MPGSFRFGYRGVSRYTPLALGLPTGRSAVGAAMVALAQSAEHWIVAPEVTGSSPVGHPKTQTSMDVPMPDAGVRFLLRSSEPAFRYAALTEFLGRRGDDSDVAAARASITSGRLVSGLLAGQQSDGGFGGHPYAKWGGAHWRLVSLIDLRVPTDTAGLREAAGTVLDWLTSPGHVRRVPVLRGRARRCASQEGNALAVATYIGMTDDPRVRELVANLVRWQWPDGGWNCDKHPEAAHSSFNESLPPLLGLARFAAATGDSEARAAADAVAEFLLVHRVIQSHHTGEIAHPYVIRLCYPPYWHYDALAALKALAESGHIADRRTTEALAFLESRRRADGTWHADAYHWRPAGSRGSNSDVVDWGRGGPCEGLTLGALRVLKAASRWPERLSEPAGVSKS
jgi:hypothetical protein